jgi:type I restriction enzyme M protein
MKACDTFRTTMDSSQYKNDPHRGFDRGIQSKNKGDYAFIASLNENGRMGVVLPHDVLFRAASEGKIRKQLIDENLLDAVIGLPANLFFATSIPASILVFKNQNSIEHQMSEHLKELGL